MIPAWSEQDFKDFHYSRMAVREIKRRRGVRSLRDQRGWEPQARRLAEQAQFEPPRIELSEQLLPVVIHDDW